MSYWGLLLLSAVGFITALAVTPTVAVLAWRFKITDRPDGNRKLHHRPIPLGGGVSVFIGLWMAIFVGMWLREPCGTLLRREWRELLSLLWASSAIVLIGLVDDRVNLRGWHKLLGQLLAGAIVASTGLEIQEISLFNHVIVLGWFAKPFTVFWLVGAMNSLNLLDGVDGLATTVGIILSLTLAVAAMLCERYVEALVIAALVGSLLGFLRFNLPPARMFLGDAGSMLIGLTVGALAIRSTLKGPATVAFAAPLAVWTIPIFDSTAAIVRRKLTGRSIYATDRGHLHHRLMARSGSSLRTLFWIGSCCLVTSLGAVTSLWLKNDLVALVTSICVMGTLIATRVFGHVELQLLSNTFRRVGGTVLGFVGMRPLAGHQTAVRLQGTRPWDQLWGGLLEFTEKFNLHSIRLDVNMPAFHEGYHASWSSPIRCEPTRLWRTEIPLFVGEQVLGRLTITGQRDDMSACDVIDRLMDFLYPFECRLSEIVSEHAAIGRAAGGSASNPEAPNPALDPASAAGAAGIGGGAGVKGEAGVAAVAGPIAPIAGAWDVAKTVGKT